MGNHPPHHQAPRIQTTISRKLIFHGLYLSFAEEPFLFPVVVFLKQIYHHRTYFICSRGLNANASCSVSGAPFFRFSNRNAHLGPRDADMASLRRPRIAPRQRVGWARSAGFWGRITGRVVLNSAIAPRVRGRFKVRDIKKRPIVHLIKKGNS